MISLDTVTQLDTLPPVSLANLQHHAEFLTRKDRKYLLPAASVSDVLDQLDGSICALEIDGQRSFTYETPYFDEDDFTSYFSALRRRSNRFKVRTRLYIESGLCQLEVKLRNSRGQTVKHRRQHDNASLTELTDDERAWLRTFPQVTDHALSLNHHMTTIYRRSTLMLSGGSGRVTIDHDVEFVSPGGHRLALPSIAIVETKGPGKPTAADRALWRLGHRPVSMSKFTVGLSLLVPELPANHWHRTRKHLESMANCVTDAGS
jgi:hypothetical protein